MARNRTADQDRTTADRTTNDADRTHLTPTGAEVSDAGTGNPAVSDARRDEGNTEQEIRINRARREQLPHNTVDPLAPTDSRVPADPDADQNPPILNGDNSNVDTTNPREGDDEYHGGPSYEPV